MTKMPFNLRVKLFEIKGTKVFSLCNNIKNNEKALHFPVSFFIPRLKMLFYCTFLIENTKLFLSKNSKINFF